LRLHLARPVRSDRLGPFGDLPSFDASLRSVLSQNGLAVSTAFLPIIWLDNCYHVATLDHDAELIFTASVEFIEKVTASLP